MIRFEEEKLRDLTWRAKFYRKLADIRSLQHQNTFIGYAKHKDIVHELIDLYEENLKIYEANYLKPKKHFDDISLQLNSKRPRIHPTHFTQLIQLQQDIQKLLEAEDYDMNARAIPLVQDLEDRMNMYISQMEAFRFNLEEIQSQLKKMAGTLWLEDVEKYEKQYQRYKTAVLGDHLPKDILVFDKKKIKSQALDRSEAISEWLVEAKSFRKLTRAIQAKTNQSLSRAEFETFQRQLHKARQKRTYIRTSAALIVATLLVLGAIYGPAFYQSYHQQQAWEVLQANPTYMGYKQFVERFEEGPLVEAARQAQLDMRRGTILGYTDSLGNTFDYEGELEQGQPHGSGKARYESGAVYEGAWIRGLREGIGTLTTPEGLKYEGQWEKNLRSGTGIQAYPDGSNYEGNWEADMPHGKGTLIRKDSNMYSGQWIEGQFEGRGTMQYADGSKYEGQWKDGQRAGNGTYYFADGLKYEGNWVNGQRQGKGNLMWKNGKIFRGNWENDMQEGEGTINWNNGGVFVGTWENGQINGRGSFTSRFREKPYEGIFKEEPNGVIVLYDSLGNETRRGRFTQGMYVISR